MKKTKSDWLKLPYETKRVFWSTLYKKAEVINKLNEDAYPTLEEWTKFVYDNEEVNQIRESVESQGICKLKDLTGF